MTEVKQYDNVAQLVFYCDRVFVAFRMDIMNVCSVWIQQNSKQIILNLSMTLNMKFKQI